MRSALLALVYVFLTLLAIPVLLVCVLFGLRDVFLAYGRWMMRVGARVLVVLPYVPDAVKAWVDVLPGQLDKVKERKHPADPAKLDDKGKQTMERYRGQEAVKGSRAFHDGMGPEHRGPAGIRLSVQGPGGLERDEVNARANVCVLLHSWPPRGVAPFHPAMTISRQVCSEDPDARFACRGFIIIAHTCIGFL